MTLAARELVPENPIIRRKLVPLQDPVPSPRKPMRHRKPVVHRKPVIHRKSAIHREQAREKNGLRRASLLLSVKVFSLALPALLFLGLILFNLIGYNKMAMIQGEIQRLNREITSLQAESDYVKMSLAPYLEPEVMARKAHQRLGMVLPSEEDLLAIQPSDQPSEEGGEDPQLAKGEVREGQ